MPQDINDKKQWQVYLLRCADNSLYCGVTNDLSARVKVHNSGQGAKYTRSRRPVSCVAQSPFMEKNKAFQLEYYIKKLPADKKITHVQMGYVSQGHRM